MEFKYTEEITTQEYNYLRNSVGWGSVCEEQAKRGLENSAYTLSCITEGKKVGFCRLIWDGGYIAFLADVMVLPEYQGMGIGKTLVEKSIKYLCQQKKEGWRIKIVLTSSLGKEGFYEQFGFEKRPNANAGAGMDLWLDE